MSSDGGQFYTAKSKQSSQLDESYNTNSLEDKEEKSVKLEIRMQFMSDETENNMLNFIVGGKSKSTEGVQQSVS